MNRKLQETTQDKFNQFGAKISQKNADCLQLIREISTLICDNYIYMNNKDVHYSLLQAKSNLIDFYLNTDNAVYHQQRDLDVDRDSFSPLIDSRYTFDKNCEINDSAIPDTRINSTILNSDKPVFLCSECGHNYKFINFCTKCFTPVTQ